MRIFRRLRSLWARSRVEYEMSEEMRHHLEEQAKLNMQRGMPPADAALAARRQFGNVASIQEQAREVRGWLWFEQGLQDIRFGVRSLARRPGFTATVVVTLALCIGANSAIFSVVNAILLKPYPWPGSDRLVFVHNNFPKVDTTPAGGISILDYLDHRAGVPALAESALITGFSANLSATDGQPERVYGLAVTPSLFALLQVSPAHGRTPLEAEAAPGAARTVVISDGFWSARFGRNPDALGQTVRLNGEPYTIIGIMPPGFYFPSQRAQLWVPLVFSDRDRSETDRLNQRCTMVARLAAGATLPQVQRQLDAVHRATRERLPDIQREHEATGYGSIVRGFLDTNVQDVRPTLWLLQAGVAVALLIGCANVASLFLARASARQREFAVRAALGASRGRNVRQLLTECLMLFAAGGLAGGVVARASLELFDRVGVANLPRGFAVVLDGPVVAFTVAVALVTALASGALPAWSATRAAAAEALRTAGGRVTTGRRQLQLRSGLIVAQVALALVLLAAAGVLVRSFQRVEAQSPGFARERTLTLSLTLPPAKYGPPERKAAFADALLARLEALPGVEAAGLTNAVPFGGPSPRGGFEIVGRQPPPGQSNPNGFLRQVSPGYFRALGIPLLRGRSLGPGDALGSERVVVVDRVFAEKHFPAGDALGQQIRRDERANLGVGTWTVVGIVAPVKHWELEEELTRETIYYPYAQAPNSSLTLVIKARPEIARAEALSGDVRAAVLAVDPEQPVFDIRTMESRIETSLEGRRTPMLLIGMFALMSAGLAAVGLYGVLAFVVGQRTPEFGVRMALGASREQILALVARQGLRLVALGLVLGLGGYALVGGLIRNLLYGVSPYDVTVLGLAALGLALVALVACGLPARRAAKVDPVIALRAE